MTAIATKNGGKKSTEGQEKRKREKESKGRKKVSAHSLWYKNVKHDGAASIVSSCLIRLII
jgi:hypothetical protein